MVFAVLDVGHSLYRISDTSRQEGSDGTTIDRTPGPDWVVQITGTSTGMTTHIPSHRNAWYTPTLQRCRFGCHSQSMQAPHGSAFRIFKSPVTGNLFNSHSSLHRHSYYTALTNRSWFLCGCPQRGRPRGLIPILCLPHDRRFGETHVFQSFQILSTSIQV